MTPGVAIIIAWRGSGGCLNLSALSHKLDGGLQRSSTAYYDAE